MILLINPPFVSKKSAYFQEFESHPYANPALAILSGVLYQNNVPFKVVDAKLDNLSPEELLNQIKLKLGDVEPTLIGVTNSTTTVLDDDLECSKAIKKLFPKTPITIGGPHVTALPEQTLQDCQAIDVVCMFEGNEVLLELYDFYTEKIETKDLASVESICFRGANGEGH